MQVILDSSFAHPGSAPIWSGKKGEFRDWTRVLTESTDCIDPRSSCSLTKQDLTFKQVHLVSFCFVLCNEPKF